MSTADMALVADKSLLDFVHNGTLTADEAIRILERALKDATVKLKNYQDKEKKAQEGVKFTVALLQPKVKETVDLTPQLSC